MAGSKVNAFETDFLELLFNNVDITGIGDASGILGSTADGSFYIALFTADPSDSGLVTNECDYIGYSRKAVVRTASGWTISGNQVSNAALISFDPCTGGSNTATHFGICKGSSSGVADLIYHSNLATSRTIEDGVTPEFAIGAIAVIED